MSTRLRNLIVLAVVVVAVAAIVRVISTVRPTTVAASSNVEDTTTVDRGDIQIVVSATGPIQANQAASMVFTATGKVATINVTEGDHVLKGQTIATLDPQTALDAVVMAKAKVDAQQIALRRLTDKPRQVDINVAKAQLNLAKARLVAAQNGPDKIQVAIANYNVEVAKNQLWQAQLQRDADRKLRDSLANNPRTSAQTGSVASEARNDSIITSRDYNVQIQQALLEDAKAQFGNIGSVTSAQAQIIAAQVALDNLLKGGNKEDVDQANARLQAAQAALDQAKADLAKTRLVAPFDGVVAKINLNLGEQAPVNAAVIMLDTSSFYVDLPIDEKDIARVALDQSAKLTFDSMPGAVLEGKVTRIADTATKSGDNVTYTIRVVIDPAGQNLISTMSTTAKIVVGQATSVLRVQNRFIRLDRATGKTFANVRQPDGSFKEVEIVLGLRSDTYSEVKSGLAAGDVIGLVKVDTLRPQAGGPGGASGQ
ncbi:MAG: efflux RND transporter periplasmic adaptor subunit [Anaerolineae bacterium]|nr:efflux RND transporter periplasmic adaptor subunit [Anaerolineae bacterium]